MQDVPETSQDSYGQPSQTATTIGTFHFSIRQLKGDERLNVRQIWPTATHVAECGWLGSAVPSSADNPNSLVLPTMKLLLKKNGTLIKVLNVLSAENVEERNRMWRITCVEHIGATS